MISNQSRTRNWIMGIREKYPRRDPILIEKMIMALILVENLQMAGYDFIFKGGTSLLLLLDLPQRFSIDIDIISSDTQNLDNCFQRVLRREVFHRFEENKRGGSLPKQHYKFYFNSAVQKKESHILLDILFEENPYPKLQGIAIQSPLVTTEGKEIKIICPKKECLLGDKLTAFAPHTTGIKFGTGKELEIIKQLFDVAILFDSVENVDLIMSTFEEVANKELNYRGMNELTPQDVLMDIFSTAIMIGMRGTSASNEEYEELLSGTKKLAAYVFSGFFSLDSAILCASKAAYLSALIMRKKDRIIRYKRSPDIHLWNIGNLDYNKLNKLKKTSLEAFHYYFRALTLLGLEGSKASIG